MVHYMFKFHKNNSTRLPYGNLITKFLTKAGILLDCEIARLTLRQIYDKHLSMIKVIVDDRNLDNVPMDSNSRKDKQDLSFEETFMTLLVIS